MTHFDKNAKFNSANVHEIEICKMFKLKHWASIFAIGGSTDHGSADQGNFRFWFSRILSSKIEEVQFFYCSSQYINAYFLQKNAGMTSVVYGRYVMRAMMLIDTTKEFNSSLAAVTTAE